MPAPEVAAAVPAVVVLGVPAAPRPWEVAAVPVPSVVAVVQVLVRAQVAVLAVVLVAVPVAGDEVARSGRHVDAADGVATVKSSSRWRRRRTRRPLPPSPVGSW